MKKLVITLMSLGAASIMFFDAILVFLLSGSIPMLNITLPPTTMLAVMIASAVLAFTLRYRHVVYARCLKFYDELFDTEKEATTPRSNKPTLPRRRYHEL